MKAGVSPGSTVRPIAERREAGYRDMRAALAAAPWLRQEMPAHLGTLVHRGRAGEGEYEPRD